MSKVGTTNLGKRIISLDVSPEFDGFSKVIIKVTEDLSYEAGTNTGRTLELTNPWGTQQMANDILAKIQGHQYQPLTAEGALLDPAAELGDGITVNGVYSGLYKQQLTFGPLFSATVEAPQDEEIDHEYPYEPSQNREITRQFANVKSQFTVQAAEIAARVTREGGDNKSFGWSLTEDGFILSSGSKTVFKATETGIEVTGKITATSGYIGSENRGFEITSNSIRNGVLSMNDTGHYGIYIGTDGICLGRGAFKVDSYGNLYANSGTFSGTVYAGRIDYGGDAGTFDGWGLTGGTVTGGQYGAIGLGEITTTNVDWGIGNSLANADWASDVLNGFDIATSLRVYNGGLEVGGYPVYLRSATLKNAAGNNVVIHYLGWESW